jgi:hypothetical protein
MMCLGWQTSEGAAITPRNKFGSFRPIAGRNALLGRASASSDYFFHLVGSFGLAILIVT